MLVSSNGVNLGSWLPGWVRVCLAGRLSDSFPHRIVNNILCKKHCKKVFSQHGDNLTLHRPLSNRFISQILNRQWNVV